jgi:hypothetical protein
METVTQEFTHYTSVKTTFVLKKAEDTSCAGPLLKSGAKSMTSKIPSTFGHVIKGNPIKM